MIGNTFWGRSGSFLLCSLFDSHPEVLTLPLSNWSYFTRILLNDLSLFSTLSSDEFSNRLLDNIPYLTEEGNEKDPWSIINSPGTIIQKIGDEVGKDIKIGAKRSVLQKCLSQMFDDVKNKGNLFKLSTLINILHIGYALSKGRTIKTKTPIILYSLHDYEPEIIEILSKEYIFMLMVSVRNPKKTLDSHLYHHLFESTHSNHMWTVIHLYKTLYYSGQVVRGLRRDQHIAIKFEDLHNKTEIVMKALCKKFNLNWDPILLSSTIDGKVWWMERENFLVSGPNPNFISQKKHLRVLKENDKIIFSCLFRDYEHAWKYNTDPLLSNKIKVFLFLKFPFLTPLFISVIKLELKKVNSFKKALSFVWILLENCKNFKVLVKRLSNQRIEPVPLFEV